MKYQTPLYHIKAVSDITGLLPVTLRAWERRYGLPSPNRGNQGYRLYTEHDIRTLKWLKKQVSEGLPIGLAVEQLNLLRDQGNDPGENPGPHTSHSLPIPAQIRSDLLSAFMRLDEPQAVEAIRKSFYYFPMDLVMADIFQNVMETLGEEWHNGRLSIAVEHFATQLITSHMLSMAASAGTPTQNGTIVAACAPGETHQVGLLMLVVLLRWRGWEVRYLGPDLSLQGLEESLSPLKPDILLFSATMPEPAKRLQLLSEVISRFPDPKPDLVLGGSAFNKFRLSESLPAYYLLGSPEKIVEEIEDILATRAE